MNEILPSPLFKYARAARVDILSHAKILFPPATKLNDPFEMRPRTEAPSEEMVKKEWDEWLKKEYAFLPPQVHLEFADFKRLTEERDLSWPERMKLMGEAYQGLSGHFQNVAGNAFGILCFTERKDNLLMWAHYAEGHTGFVIEFNSSHEFFRGSFVHNVLYSTERPVYRRQENDVGATFWTKGHDWAYEAEWRMFVNFAELEKRNMDNGKEGYFSTVPLDCISAIYLGCQTAVENEQKIVEALKLPGREHIKAFKGKVHPDVYSLVFEPLSR